MPAWKGLDVPYEWKAFLIAGVAAGAAGAGLFGLIHAVIIVPIWGRLLGGLPFAAGAGLALGWAARELSASGRFGLTARGGLAFGLLMWSTLIPATGMGAVLRLTGFHGTNDAWETLAECLLAFA